MSVVANLWDWALAQYGNDQFNVTVYGTLLATAGWFWIVCVGYTFVDVTGLPAWVVRYKTQPGRNQPVDLTKLMSAIKVALLNQLFISTPLTLLQYPIHVLMEIPWKTEELPTLWIFLKDLAIIVIVEEIGFYYSHRLVHWPPLYKAIHKKHHEWTAPIGVVAIYAHPVEMFLSNLCPLIAGPFITKCHVFTAWVWYIVAIFTTVTHHSGYHLPLFPSPEFHDFHHLKFNYNYGVFGFLDWLHGTDKLFRDMGYDKRNKILLGLTPVGETYPTKYSKTHMSGENGHCSN